MRRNCLSLPAGTFSLRAAPFSRQASKTMKAQQLSEPQQPAKQYLLRRHRDFVTFDTFAFGGVTVFVMVRRVRNFGQIDHRKQRKHKRLHDAHE